MLHLICCTVRTLLLQAGQVMVQIEMDRGNVMFKGDKVNEAGSMEPNNQVRKSFPETWIWIDDSTG